MKKENVKLLLGTAAGMAAGGKLVDWIYKPLYEKEKRIQKYYHILNHWLDLRQSDRYLYDYFDRKGYKRIGIYGMHELGERLYYELKDFDVELCLIDKSADAKWFEMDIISPKEPIPQLDVMVVAASYYFEDIKKELSGRVSCPIIPIEEVVESLWP